MSDTTTIEITEGTFVTISKPGISQYGCRGMVNSIDPENMPRGYQVLFQHTEGWYARDEFVPGNGMDELAQVRAALAEAQQRIAKARSLVVGDAFLLTLVPLYNALLSALDGSD
jgi:hypothetical protein